MARSDGPAQRDPVDAATDRVEDSRATLKSRKRTRAGFFVLALLALALPGSGILFAIFGPYGENAEGGAAAWIIFGAFAAVGIIIGVAENWPRVDRAREKLRENERILRDERRAAEKRSVAEAEDIVRGYRSESPE